MTLLSPWGLLALGLLVPIIILHMLTPRRPPTLVSSLLHWDGLKHSITAAEPWQRLRWSLLLLLQLLAVILFALALANPARTETAVLAEHTVFVIDASGSMAAIDGSPDRIADATTRASELRAEIPEGGAASIVVASSNPTILLQESTDADEFNRAVGRIVTNSGGPDYEAAFALAESLVSAQRPTGFVLVSDGGLTETDQRLAPLDTRFEPIGKTDTNRAITGLTVTAGPGGLQARVTIESTGGPDAFQTIRIDVDGVTVDRRDLEIPSGQVIEELFELPLGQEVAAYLDGNDLIAFDNQRFVAAPVTTGLKARVIGENTFFIDELLAAIPEIDLDVAPGEEVDFEIYLGTPVPPDIDKPFIAVDVPAGVPGITPTGRAENPIPTLVADDPLLRDIDVSRIAIADSQILTIDEGEVLLGAPGAPLLIRGNSSGNAFFYIAFTLEQSNLPVNVAFPIIGARMVGELSAAEATTASITVGDRVPIPGDATRVTDPRGVTQNIDPAQPHPVADVAGFWRVDLPDSQILTIAVNSAVSESHVAPVEALDQIRSATGESGATLTEAAVIARSILPWVLASLLLVLAAELIVSSRQVGVPKKQWRWGLATRGVIVALILLVLVNPSLSFANNSVTTVFLVDTSESLGSSTQAARAWVEAAIAEAGDNRWAVVEFGKDARVSTPVGQEDYFNQPSIDGTATNFARALRLGESLLDGRTKQRLVIVSDGRTNAGNVDDEIDRLKALGMVVEVHTVSGQLRSDAAVAGIDVPSFVNEGESYEATIEVLSTISAPGQLDLLSDGEVIASETVDLAPGSNLFTYTVEGTTPGLQNLTARVRIAGDEVAQNDETATAVEVRGPASVLIIEGSDGEGEIIKDALEARGLVVQTIPVDDFPTLNELSIHRAVLLVNISARQVKDEQVATLGTYVRDLGRGMVVVGGDNSYALGGYQETELEALLPVDSEAQDAKREAPVAEVLLIDTSESMGACHCREPENGGEAEFLEGGIQKTDIAKTAALRATEVLSAQDEIGLLAFSGSSKWVIPLQPVPSNDVVEQGVSGLSPFGETKIVPALEKAAEALRNSDKELKHIILFTDGFTSELNIDGFSDPSFGNTDQLKTEAEKLFAEGITLSVVGTGEGAIPALQEIAAAGGGRFYPGRDLDEIPEIFVKEARLAARSFINEGEFYPSVTSTAAAVRDLASSPALLGYLAGTAKPIADVQLQVGEFADPLLSSWRVGLGSVTAWMSDGGEKWASQWATWDGYTDFWSNLVRDTFPLAGSEGQRVEARISNETLQITLEGSEPWPNGATPVAQIGYPDGTSEQVRLDRKSEFEFEASVPARQGGAYAVGVSVENADGDAVVISSIASRSFAAEFLPGEPDPDLMTNLSAATGGRGQILANQAFDNAELEPGSSDFNLRWWLLGLAALLWPLDVALRRLRLGRSDLPPRLSQSTDPQPTPRTPEASQTH